MSIYTRRGDQGETDLLGNIRVAKDHPALEVCGTLDELNSLLGLVRCEPLPREIDDLLEHVQHRIFDLGAEIAAGASDASKPSTVGPGDIQAIERSIDRWEATLGPTKSFLLPKGCRAAALLHLARAVCRRAERRMVSLAKEPPQPASPAILIYLNRLSDLLFVLAREVNRLAGTAETPC